MRFKSEDRNRTRWHIEMLNEQNKRLGQVGTVRQPNLEAFAAKLIGFMPDRQIVRIEYVHNGEVKEGMCRWDEITFDK